jgi:tyramine---L-glutamate ligase
MRVFLYEFTCCGRCSNSISSRELRAEGWAMLSALVEDFQRIPEVEVLSFLNSNVFGNNHQRPFLHIDLEDEERTFREFARQADITLVIAPEFENILSRRCEWVQEGGGRLLGPCLDAIRTTADKYDLRQILRDCGVPTPECHLLAEKNRRDVPSFPAVLKPRFGAGSLTTYLVGSAEELERLGGSAEEEMILQPFVPGQPASVSFFIGPQQRLPLLPASQIISDDGRFHYLGGEIPLPAPLAKRAQSLATRAIDAISGLQGYVGVDLVLGTAEDGNQDWVIEINPRLTTSYIGLRTLAETNLAETLLEVALGQEAPPLRWRSGFVRFYSDGRVDQ